MLLRATELLAAAGELPVNVRFAIDAEEEIGGHSVVDWVAEDTGPADVAVVFDGGYATETLPSICTALRGICYFHVTVRTGERDLHSGMFGGAALDATHALMEMLAGRAARAGRAAARAAPRRDRRRRPPTRSPAGRRCPSGSEELASAGARPVDGVGRRGVLRADDGRAVDHRQRLRGRLAAPPEDRAPGRGAGERLDPARAGAVARGDRARRSSGCSTRPRRKARASRSSSGRPATRASSIPPLRRSGSRRTRSSTCSGRDRC